MEQFLRSLERIDERILAGAQWIANQIHYGTGVPFYQQARVCFVIGLCFVMANTYNEFISEPGVIKVVAGSISLLLLIVLLLYAGRTARLVKAGYQNDLRHAWFYVRVFGLIWSLSFAINTAIGDMELVNCVTMCIYMFGFYLLSCDLPPPREERKWVEA